MLLSLPSMFIHVYLKVSCCLYSFMLFNKAFLRDGRDEFIKKKRFLHGYTGYTWICSFAFIPSIHVHPCLFKSILLSLQHHVIQQRFLRDGLSAFIKKKRFLHGYTGYTWICSFAFIPSIHVHPCLFKSILLSLQHHVIQQRFLKDGLSEFIKKKRFLHGYTGYTWICSFAFIPSIHVYPCLFKSILLSL